MIAPFRTTEIANGSHQHQLANLPFPVRISLIKLGSIITVFWRGRTEKIKHSLFSLVTELSAPLSDKSFRLSSWSMLWLPLVLLVLATLIIRLTGIDYLLQLALYTAAGNSWNIGKHPFWHGLYEYATTPATAITCVSLIGFVISWHNDHLRPWRRIFLLIILFMIFAPGIITNGLLKEYWGRPRPRQILGLGGLTPFEPLLTYNPLTSGKSFPCGHATVGYFWMLGYFVFRGYRQYLAHFFLGLGLVLGTLMGLGRSAQGGHFLSDTIFAAAICWFTALGLSAILQLNSGPLRMPKKSSIPLPVRWGIIGAGAAAMIGLALASPFRNARNHHIDIAEAPTARLHVTLHLLHGNAQLEAADAFSLTGEAWGHGVPTASLVDYFFVKKPTPDRITIHYTERVSGFFTEVQQELNATIPWERMDFLELKPEDSAFHIRLPDKMPTRQTPLVLRLTGSRGEVVIQGATQETLPDWLKLEFSGFSGKLSFQESRPDQTNANPR